MFNEKILQQIDNYEVELPANDWDILSQKLSQKRRKAFPLWWYAAAAGVALLVGFGFVFFDTQMTQIEPIYTDNYQKYPTAESTENTQRAQNNLCEPRINFALIVVEKNTIDSAENTQRTQDNHEILNAQQQATSNKQPTISIEEAEKLMHASTSLNDRNDTAMYERNRRQKNNNQQPTSNSQYYASISASASPTTFGRTETTPRRMFIPAPDGSSAIMRNIGTEIKHDLPLTFAFTFGIPLVKRLYLNTGVQYTYIHSKIEKFENDTRKPISRDEQELHYLGIPLMLSYRIVDKKIFKFYVSGGGVAEKGLLETHNQKIFKEVNPESVVVPTVKPNPKIPGFQFSLNANLGASVTLVKGLALYAEPGFAWYIPAIKYPQPISRRTKSPFFVNITLGLRFNFDK